jgi:putative FmdB family regulatory protein
MPTYEYLCPAGHEFELLQKMSDKPRAKCPSCGKLAARRISGGAALVFKGSGFYITDYGKDGKGPRKDPSKAEPPPKGESKAEAKSEASPGKSEPAPVKPEPRGHGKKAK